MWRLSTFKDMAAVKIIIFLLFSIVIVAFAVENMHSVEVNYYDLELLSQSVSLPLIFLMVGPFFLGLLLAWALAVWERMKLRTTLRRQNRALNTLQKDLDKFRPPAPADEPTGIGTDY